MCDTGGNGFHLPLLLPEKKKKFVLLSMISLTADSWENKNKTEVNVSELQWKDFEEESSQLFCAFWVLNTGEKISSSYS